MTANPIINVTKWPVVILANYRSGSSVLADKLGQDYNVPVFSEPSRMLNEIPSYFGEHVNGVCKKFYDFYKSNATNKYVIKFMPTQLSLVNPFVELLESDCYKIRVIRKDIVSQIASCYIAKMRDKWQTVRNETNPEYTVEFNENTMLYVLAYCTTNDFVLKHSDIKFDNTVYYEDLGHVDHPLHGHTTQPTNLEEIKEYIRKKIF